MTSLTAISPELATAFFSRPRRTKSDAGDGNAGVPGAVPFSFRHARGLVRGATVGKSGRTVLLVHGWESCAAHLHAFLPHLLHAGFRVAMLDAPAHGASEGEETNVAEIGDALLMASEQIGAVDAVIAHSVGSPAALYAISRGLQVGASVHIAGPSSLERVLQRHAAMCGLNEEGFLAFRALVHGKFGADPQLLEMEAMIGHLNHPGLLIHDRTDKEVPFDESSRLHAAWRASELLAVEDLGHRRIIQDGNVIARTTAFLLQNLN